jgi:hypothetical protein
MGCQPAEVLEVDTGVYIKDPLARGGEVEWWKPEEGRPVSCLLQRQEMKGLELQTL